MKIITMELGLADNGAINSFSFHSNSVCRTKGGAVITIYSECGGLQTYNMQTIEPEDS